MKTFITNKVRLILFFSIVLFIQSFAQTQTVRVISGQFTSNKDNQILKSFIASKGDVIDINVVSLHKKRGVGIYVVQHPGNMVVLEMDEVSNTTKKIIAPADVVYQVYYGGERVDFEINITNNTSKPSGPGRGDIVYVRIPDTVHVSGYVNKPIGENYKLSPYKEKVILNQVISTEPIANRDFITGLDLMNLYIPGDIKDEYREQKLLSVNASLTVDAPSSYNAISGVVKAGMDAFIPDLSPTKFIGKNKTKKMNPNNMYEVVQDAQKEKEKWEKTVETIKLAQELGDSLRPGKSTNADKVLQTTGFLLDTDGMKEMALNKGLKAVGASNEVLAIADKIMNIPSATDFLKSGFDKYASKIKGRANLKVLESRKFSEPLCAMPDSNKEFYIQSAMNYGKNLGGYWDLPAKPSVGKNGEQLKCWDLDEGIDRKFKFVPSTRFSGFYEIHSALNGYAIDNSGGNSKINKDGTDLVLWQRHGAESQVFRIKHLGNGRIRIYNYADKVVHLTGRKNNNGTDISIWGEHEGEWMDWYLIDAATKTVYVPQNTSKSIDIWRDVAIVNETGGAINKTIEIAKETEPLKPDFPFKQLNFVVREVDYVSDAKLIVEAKYLITDYTDIIKYRREKIPVTTRDYWTAYKVNYDYAIMLKDQAKDYYEIIEQGEYNNPQRTTSEQVNVNNIEQKNRLDKFNVLTAK